MGVVRLYILWIFIGLAMGALLVGLWRLQINRGEYYLTLSRENRIKHIALEAPRGSIYDRHQRLLVDNRPSFDVLFVGKELKKYPQTISRLAQIMNVDVADIWAKIRKSCQPVFLPNRLFRDITRKKVAIIEENALHLPGVFVSVQPKRDYIHGDLAAHVLGYVGEINAKELKALRPHGYGLGDILGKKGMEKVYEPYLKGQKGGRQIEVNALGHPKQELGYKAPKKGNDLVITLDLDVQRIAQQAMAGHKGAVVVMDPSNGEVLAMVSCPGFDPNIFVQRSRSQELKKVLNDRKEWSLLNRAIGAAYPPSSIFKIFIGLTGILEKKVTGTTQYYCSGSYQIGRLFHCWYEDGHSDVNLVQALRTSCNIYFYRLTQKMPIDNLVAHTKNFGFGQPTGIDLLNEKSGFVPSRAWKQKRFRQRWYPGETANFSIGQGYLLVTPLQMLTAVNSVINGGKWIQPHLVRWVQDADGQVFEILTPKVKRFNWSPEQLGLIHQGMREVVNDPRGTGQRAFLEEVVVAGKTGTAQVVGKQKKKSFGDQIPEKYRNHAWFTGYAPFDEPKVSVIVFLEHGESGGRYAAKVAQHIFNDIFALPTYGNLTIPMKDKLKDEEV